MNAPSTPIRVLHVLDGRWFGGGEMAFARLARHIDPARVAIEAACMEEGRLTAMLANQATPFTMIKRPRLSRFRSARGLSRLMTSHGIDVVHTHTSGTNLVGRMAALLSSAIHIATIHSPVRLDINDRAKRRRLASFIDRAGSRISKKIVFVSQEERQRQVDLGLAESKAIWIPNGVEPAAPAQPAELDALRAQWGLNEGCPVVCMVAQLRPRKGPDVLLQAIPELLKKHPETKVVFVGSAEFVESRDYLAELKAMSAQLGIERNVVFAGFCDTIPAALELADVNVLPSRFGEGLPLALLEAMAAGTPVVASDTEGNREAVRHGRNGLLVPAEDSQALASALASLLENPDLRKKMGAEGRKDVREKYEIGAVARRHEILYDAVCGH
jgi:glycosyltransferase involved in cell wall biosynthesis